MAAPHRYIMKVAPAVKYKFKTHLLIRYRINHERRLVDILTNQVNLTSPTLVLAGKGADN